MRTFFYILAVILCFKGTTQNIIKNPNFQESQNNLSPVCIWDNPDKFNDYVMYWRTIRQIEWTTPDFMVADYTQCVGSGAFEIWNNDLNNWFVFMALKEGIRSELKEEIAKNQQYVIRFLYSSTGTAYINVFVSKHFDNWRVSKELLTYVYDNDANYSSLEYPYINASWWKEKYAVISLSKNNYDNIIIVADKDNEMISDAILVDNVQLYKYCPDILLIENWLHFTKEYPYEAQVVKAGYNVGNQNPDGNVIVKSGASIVYKGVTDVYLEPGFETEPGAEFLAFIAPCGQMCDPLPTPNAGDDVLWCSSEPLTLGSTSSLPEDVEVHWTANPSNMLQFLDNPNSLHPVFMPPTFCGQVTFTMTLENICNETVSDQVFVQFNGNNEQYNNIIISNLNISNNVVSFLAGTNSCTEYIQVEVFSAEDNYQNPVYSQQFIPGIDYPCCFLDWTSEGLSFPPCFDYKIRVSARGLCNATYVETWLNWPRSEEVELLQVYNIITANGDNQNQCLVFETSGAEFFNVKVFNKYGNGNLWNLFYDESGLITSNQLITWCPLPFSVSDGTYFWTADFWNSCGNYIYPGGELYVVSSGGNQINTDGDQSDYIDETTPKIYPNPADNELFVNSGDYYAIRFEISDITGRIMKTENLSSDDIQSVDISDLPEGLYIFRLFTSSQDVFTFKFFKHD